MNESVWNESLEFGALQYYTFYFIPVFMAKALNIVSWWHISQRISKCFIISHILEEVVKEEDEAEYIDVKEEIYRQPEVEKSAGIFFLLFDYIMLKIILFLG